LSKKTVERIKATGNYYLIKVKQNQKRLFAAIQQVVAQRQAFGSNQSYQHCRDRSEYRQLLLYRASKESQQNWPGLRWFIQVKRFGKRQGEDYERISYYISSYKKKSKKEKWAQVFAQAIRGHWLIENRLHWQKDVSFNEDGCRISKGQAAENLSLLINMAINLMRNNGFDSIKEAMAAFANKIGLLSKFIGT
jgi:predicted transposase YbfD/YdcC